MDVALWKPLCRGSGQGTTKASSSSRRGFGCRGQPHELFQITRKLERMLYLLKEETPSKKLLIGIRCTRDRSANARESLFGGKQSQLMDWFIVNIAPRLEYKEPLVEMVAVIFDGKAI